MARFPKPRIVISKCIEFDYCRYNGAMIPSVVVTMLKPYVEFTPVCPEVEIGLGVPREPIRIVDGKGGLTLLQPATKRDVTDGMNSFADTFLGSLGDSDGFILKFRSPSCGLKDVKIYPSVDAKNPVGRGPGFFGAAVLERFARLAVEDEGRLANFRIREHFLTRVFTFARFRELRAAPSMRGLVKFHAENKLLLMAYNQREMRVLGRIVANPEKRPLPEVFALYEARLYDGLASAPRYTSSINVLMHAMGHFSEQLSAKEKAFFLGMLEEYRQGIMPLSVPVGIMRSYAVRFQNEYLMEQRFFEPYPEDLVAITDSGKGRDF